MVADASVESSYPAKHVGKDELRILRLKVGNGLEYRGWQLLEHGMIDKACEIVENNLKTS